jgi:phage FluMu protein Com
VGEDKDIRCGNCGKLLMTGVVDGNTKIEKDCPSCGERNVIEPSGVTTKPKNEKPFQQRLRMERK